MALLEINRLNFRVPARVVLEGLDLSVAASEIHALVGTNGTGKSTLAYLIMGSEGYRADAGEIRFDGQRIDALPLHERARLGITLAWQEPARFEGLSVGNYLHLGKGEIDAEDCLQRVGLAPADYLNRMADRAILADVQTAHMMASGHRLLSRRQVPGLELVAEETADGIVADIRVVSGMRLANPLHLCFGVLPAVGRQHIRMHLVLEDDAELDIVAHCFFPNAEQVEHLMDAVVEVGAGARLTYTEGHYHGPYGGVSVVPRATVKVGKHGLYRSDFSLTTGPVGKLDIDYEVEADEEAVVELTARVFGHGTDAIRIRERLVLAGRAARGLIKTRVALEHDATAEIVGITEGNAAQARGHVDCMEIVKDRAVASAQPLVKVTHPEAKVTHEAAIGSVDHHQLETLMAHGLSPEQAVDLIVGGLLGKREGGGVVGTARSNVIAWQK